MAFTVFWTEDARFSVLLCSVPGAAQSDRRTPALKSEKAVKFVAAQPDRSDAELQRVDEIGYSINPVASIYCHILSRRHFQTLYSVNKTLLVTV